MQTSRGCPAACLFCDIRKTAFRKRSPHDVLSELNSLLDQGIDDIFFVDDTITIDKQRVFELCELIVANRRRFHFKISARVGGDGKVLSVSASAPAAIRESGAIPCIRKAVYDHRFPSRDGPAMAVDLRFDVD